MTHTTYNNTKSMLIVGSIVALSMVALTNPAAAYGGQQNHQMPVTSNDITVNNSNSATVSNTVVVGANTGYNSVAGGTSGKAGNGGNVHGTNGKAGNGGTSGGSNNDGYIATGNAASLSAISNDINTNRTKITTNCGCQGKNGGDVTVNNQNNANIGNAVVAGSNTGYNGVTGGNTGVAGNGGNTASQHSWLKWNNHHMNNNGGATAGNGGNTGTSNNVGTILTGDSLSDSLVVNVVNRNITRIK